MILAHIKNRCNALIYKKRYPHSKIALGAYISKDSFLGMKTEIGANTCISNSNIGNDVTIGVNCSIANVKIDSKVTVYSNCAVNEVAIGKFSYIASNSEISMTKIGSFCSIGPYLLCGYGEHPTDFVSTSPLFFSTLKQSGHSFADRDLVDERKQILVGHDVWIGAKVFIRDGVSVGSGAVVGAGAVVVKDIPDYAIVAGVPAKVIRYRFSDEIISKLLSLQWWNWPEEKLRRVQPYLAQKDVSAFIEWATCDRC